MDTKQKLLDLLGGTNFRLIGGSSSVQEFKEIVQYNEKQYARIEAKGDQYQERILDLMSLILAEILQPVMIGRFGNTSGYSLHRILDESFYAPEMESEWKACNRTALQALSDNRLDANQMTIISNVIDYLPDTMINLIVWVVGRLKLVPMQEVGNISRMMSKMMKEEGYDDNTGHN